MNNAHAAEGAALGFLYQSFYALRSLVLLTTDDASVMVERLDDVELRADGQTLLYQLKHSISAAPPPVTLKSRALWRTMKVWTDALPQLTLSETKLHLVATGSIPSDSPLMTLTSDTANRRALVSAMTEEAKRVLKARDAAKKEGKTPLPYGDRIDGCTAFLTMSQTDRTNLLRRVSIKPDSPSVQAIESEIAGYFHLVLPEYRAAVARRLVEWWDRQVVYSMCGARDRMITRAELQSQIMTIVADLEQDHLVPEFELLGPPADYQPDSLLTRQIDLVKGKPFDLKRAIREEWKAREQRGSWTISNPAMRSAISAYDDVLCEHWSDRHDEMVDRCSGEDSNAKCTAGLDLLRWTHNHAPSEVRPIARGWAAPYYVRGSYQVLAINQRVGWHPDYVTLLKGRE
ncbi:ABC-three component system protein [Achromobacter deleyi]|uniref:ABC-three component system protein n=1 Tax=Achromobacter deleyi TaxID=1353891 RepID=UPI001C2E5C6B|nr:ABC-three component system protein [Achromobacter deleyi]